MVGAGSLQLAFDPVEQSLAGGLGNLGNWLGDGGERTGQIRRHRDIVETDDGNVLGHGKACIEEASDAGNGGQIIGADEGGRAVGGGGL